VIREAGKRFVVMDTAPTGHTLLLLDATGAYHREIAKKMGDKGHFSTPMMQLQDPERTKVLLVTLPETTPVLEAANLQADLERAGIHGAGLSITVFPSLKPVHRCFVSARRNRLKSRL
jgi:arsenite-transporting ATPase